MKSKPMKLSVILTACLVVATAFHSAAQTDPHFTQNYTYPMYINPAMTGSSDGDYRASAIYRSQWGGVGSPYRTAGVSFDTRTNNNLALGVNLMNQSAGDGGFNYFNTYASIAYTGVRFGKDENHRLVFAMQAGLINRRIDQSKFKWGEQWDPVTGYNGSHATTENFAATSATTLDMGAGAMYYDATPDKKVNLFGGISFYHINKPSDPIISSQAVEANTIPMRYTVHGGVSLGLFESFKIVPHFLYNQQGNARETMLGVYVQKTVNEETSVMVGSYYRYKDAVAPYFGIDYKDFVMGISYDLNTSKLGSMAKNVNSFELTFSYIKRKRTNGVLYYNPCPRL
jgi:type IX secretion system PorP/SprF family membrane protein